MMFGWYSIGLVIAVTAVINIYIGFGLALLILRLCENAQPEPKPYPGKYDVNEEVDMILEAMEL